MQRNKIMVASLAFAMYFLTGGACVLVGSSLPQLVQMYDRPLEQVTLLGSAYAFGRLLTVYGTGRLVERLGPLKVLMGGVVLTGLFLLGIPLMGNFIVGMVLAVLGGIGMGAQDTVCPSLLSLVFTKHYASALSGGQGLFGLGTFVMPTLIGVLLSGNMPFYWAYFVLAAIAIAMLVAIPFARTTGLTAGEEGEEHIEPLYVKSTWAATLSIVLTVAAFSCVSSALGLYITSFAIDKGISEANAAFMFTAYNIGCVIGGFFFAWVLRFIKGQTVLPLNCAAAAVVIAISMVVDQPWFYFLALFVAGLFLGALFSVIVGVATRIWYRRVSVASSLVAMASGAADFLTPMVTGFIIASVGIGFSFVFAVIMLVVCAGAAFVLRAISSEKPTAAVEAA